MMHSTNTLYAMLQQMLIDINEQITAIKFQVQEANQKMQTDYAPEDVTDANGKPVLMEMYLAKAQILSGMAQLRASHDLSGRK